MNSVNRTAWLVCWLTVAMALPLPIPNPDAPDSKSDGTPAVPETPEESFARSDNNNDLKLTFNEFLHTDLVYEQLKREEFEGLDANHDGVVTKTEYDTHFQKEKENGDDLKAEYFGQIFEEFDQNADLILNKAELERVMKKRYSLKVPKNFGKIVSDYDQNHDGGLDINEYLKFDAELDFSQFEPLPQDAVVSTQQTSTAPAIDDKSAETAESESSTLTPTAENLASENSEEIIRQAPPILAFKTEKLPMMKKKMWAEKLY